MRKIRKAATSAALAFPGGLGLAMLDGSLTWAEVIAAGGVALVVGFGVYKVPNQVTP